MLGFLRNAAASSPTFAMAAIRLFALTKGMTVSFVSDPSSLIKIQNDNRVIMLRATHYAYALDMVRHFDYFHGAVLPTTTGEGVRVVDYSQPATHTLSGSGLSLFFTALPEADDTSDLYLACSRLRPSAVVWDLGAYCGASTIRMAEAVQPSGTVYAFEADPANHTALVHNISNHNCRNVHAYNMAIWTHATRITFQAEGSLGSAAAEAGIHRRHNLVCQVPAIGLNDVAAEVRCNHVDVVKMDIEGAEMAALSAAGPAFWDLRPHLIIEPHVVKGQLVTPLLRTLLSRHGYTSTVVAQGGLHLPLVMAAPTS
jgi:FkbM family methyltransferase